jgi:manganese/zinc/iron transport system substrate-binding protein
MIADPVRRIGGEHVDVFTLMGPGARDPHLYKARERGYPAVGRQADVIFTNGLHLEGKMGDVFKRLARKKRVVGGHRVPRRTAVARSPPELTGAYDPHVWFDVALSESGG